MQLESCATQYLWANREEIGEGTVSELSANISAITNGFKSLYGTTEMPVSLETSLCSTTIASNPTTSVDSVPPCSWMVSGRSETQRTVGGCRQRGAGMTLSAMISAPDFLCLTVLQILEGRFIDD